MNFGEEYTYINKLLTVLTPPIIRSSKAVIAASCFTYVFGFRLPLRWLSHRSGNRKPKTYVKPEAAITVFELLIIGGVSPETCWAIKKHWNNKFYYTVASCWFFLWDFLSPTLLTGVTSAAFSITFSVVIKILKTTTHSVSEANCFLLQVKPFFTWRRKHFGPPT